MDGQTMPEGNHKTRAVQVWADVDEGIADMVVYLNTIDGVRTIASCQGTIGEGGPNPYRPQVMAAWTVEAFERLRKEFDVTLLGDGWGYIHPKEDSLTTPFAA
jgi:hypothetical protein